MPRVFARGSVDLGENARILVEADLNRDHFQKARGEHALAACCESRRYRRVEYRSLAERVRVNWTGFSTASVATDSYCGSMNRSRRVTRSR